MNFHVDDFCIWQRVLSRCRPCRALRGRKTYPVRPVAMIVPASAGGPTDAIGRIMAQRMRVSLGQTVIVEDVSGAGGSIGVGRVARAAPDGYTIGIGHWTHYVLNGAIYSLPYDLLKDFEPVAMIATGPLVIVAKKALPANNLKELVTWLKANPGKASAGTGWRRYSAACRWPFFPENH